MHGTKLAYVRNCIKSDNDIYQLPCRMVFYIFWNIQNTISKFNFNTCKKGNETQSCWLGRVVYLCVYVYIEVDQNASSL